MQASFTTLVGAADTTATSATLAAMDRQALEDELSGLVAVIETSPSTGDREDGASQASGTVHTSGDLSCIPHTAICP